MAAADGVGTADAASVPISWRGDIDRLFGGKIVPVLDAESLPAVASAITAVLKVPAGSLPDRRVRDVFARAISVGADRLAVDEEAKVQYAALIGAQAYLLLGPKPSKEEMAGIAAVNGMPSLPVSSKTFRWSWARYAEQRALGIDQSSAFAHEKQGRRNKGNYLDALTAAVATVLGNPMHLRKLPETTSSATGMRGAAVRLLEDGAGFAVQIRVRADLYVPRSIEDDLMAAVLDPSHSWCHAVVGDSGHGKSSLLAALHDRLRDDTSAVPILVSATWFRTSKAKRFTVDRLLKVVDQVIENGTRAVVLLDTADLLLHDQASLESVNVLLGALGARGVTAVLTSRPREAELLSGDELRVVQLSAYDDEELIVAVTSLAAVFTNSEAQYATIAQVLAATARGLPVEEVCRSPLLLRVLFELADGQVPELREVDVTHLYGNYWERRIVRDARTEIATGFDIDPNADLSVHAGLIALAMLAAGTPELDLSTLTDLAGRISDTNPVGSPTNLRQGLDTLTQRGVLLRTGARVRFFHQTVFEFAAARALARRLGPAAVPRLLPRVTEDGGDLFVGAALEQLLILLGSDPTAEGPIAGALTMLLSSRDEPVQDIALVAWAHHRHLLRAPDKSLRDIRGTTLARATLVIPSVAGVEPADACAQLELIWAHGNEDVYLGVASALRRLAGRGLADVARSMERLRLVEALTGEEIMSEEEIAVVSDLLHVVAPIQSDQARNGLRLLVAAAVRAEDMSALATQVRRIAENWTTLADDLLFNDLVDLLEWRTNPSQELIDATAQLIAVHREQDVHLHSDDGVAEWNRWVASVLAPARGSHSILVAARVLAIGYLLATFPEGPAVGGTIRQLLAARDTRAVQPIVVQVLSRLLASGGPATEEVTRQLREALSRLGANAEHISGDAATALAIVASPEVPSGRLASILPNHISEKKWAGHPLLLQVVPAAAAAGNGPAQRVIRDLPSTIEDLKFSDREALLRHGMLHVLKYSPLVPLIVVLNINLNRVEETIKIAGTADLRGMLTPHREELLHYVNALLAGPPDHQLFGARLGDALIGREQLNVTWRELNDFLNTVSQIAARRTLISSVWKLPHGTPANLAQQIRYLGRSIVVSPEADIPVLRNPDGPDTDPTVLDACRSAWLRLIVLHGVPSSDQWPTVKALSLHTVGSATASSDGRDLALATSFLGHLATIDPDAAKDALLDYLRSLDAVEFNSHALLLWRRELQTAIRRILAVDRSATIAELIRAVPALNPLIAIQVVEVLAQREYKHVRTHLSRLLRSDLDNDLRRSIVQVIRDHDRSAGARAYPELIRILNG